MATPQQDKTLLAIENICQLMRGTKHGYLTPEAIEGICRHPGLFEQIGLACRAGRLTAHELKTLHRRHVELEDSVASKYRSAYSDKRVEQWSAIPRMTAVRGYQLCDPFAVECTFRGNIRYTAEQLKQLHHIPYSTATLGEELRQHDAILFPGHPEITLGFLLELFAPDIGAGVHVAKHDYATKITAEERVTERLALGWYLIRLKPEPIVEEANFAEQARRVDEVTHRMPTAVEFATAVLLATWRVLEEGYDWRVKEFPESQLTHFGAWCVDKDRFLPRVAGDQYGNELVNARWVIGPYVFKKEDEPGLHLRQFEEAKRERTVQLFLVRKPDQA